jgi:hypothetical protein
MVERAQIGVDDGGLCIVAHARRTHHVAGAPRGACACPDRRRGKSR